MTSIDATQAGDIPHVLFQPSSTSGTGYARYGGSVQSGSTAIFIYPRSPSVPAASSTIFSTGEGLEMSDEKLDKMSDRLNKVEIAVGRIEERLYNHVPTKADVQGMLTAAQNKILGAIAVVVIGAIAKWLWPV